MISILAQERLLGVALGSAFSGIVIFEHRRSIHESISISQAQPKEPMVGTESREEFAHLWNIPVEYICGKRATAPRPRPERTKMVGVLI